MLHLVVLLLSLVNFGSSAFITTPEMLDPLDVALLDFVYPNALYAPCYDFCTEKIKNIAANYKTTGMKLGCYTECIRRIKLDANSHPDPNFRLDVYAEVNSPEKTRCYTACADPTGPFENNRGEIFAAENFECFARCFRKSESIIASSWNWSPYLIFFAFVSGIYLGRSSNNNRNSSLEKRKAEKKKNNVDEYRNYYASPPPVQTVPPSVQVYRNELVQSSKSVLDNWEVYLEKERDHLRKQFAETELQYKKELQAKDLKAAANLDHVLNFYRDTNYDLQSNLSAANSEIEKLKKEVNRLLYNLDLKDDEIRNWRQELYDARNWRRTLVH